MKPLPPPPPLWKWLWWSLIGRCLRCGAPRAPLIQTTRCADCVTAELDAR